MVESPEIVGVVACLERGEYRLIEVVRLRVRVLKLRVGAHEYPSDE